MSALILFIYGSLCCMERRWMWGTLSLLIAAGLVLR